MLDYVTKLKVEDVFKVSGVPVHTFVRPSEFNRLKVALRTPGRGVIVEGPSGIGKSTAVAKVLEELSLASNITQLSARRPVDAEYIDILPDLDSFGTVVIDDFHRLENSVKSRIADLLKVTADTEDSTRKLVIIGINDAGRTLIDSAPDLANRLDVIKFEVEPADKIRDLVTAGESALNTNIDASELIIEHARGSFYVAQLLCLDACIQAGVIEREDHVSNADTTYSAIQRKVVDRQREKFGDSIRSFARGTKFRPSGRAPYLHILQWLTESDSWSIAIYEEMRKHPSEKSSVGQVLEKGYLANLTSKADIAKLLHFDEKSGVLSVEDPMLVFYLRSINWGDFIRSVGFTRINYSETYDIALSFAGEDRQYAEHLRDSLEDRGHAVYYDLTEQHQLLAENIADILGPIYSSGCRYVVAVLGAMYGRKRWTLFEASHYKDRLDRGEVIPIWSRNVEPVPFDTTRDLGGLNYDPDGDLIKQAKEHAEIISKKLAAE